MPHLHQLALFTATALVLAIMPGPGMLYVAGRTLTGGRREGLASSAGTGAGGLVHVVAASFGLSALILASAQLFAVMKLVGAAYLVWLGVKTLAAARRETSAAIAEARQAKLGGAARAFRDGIAVEAFNPKTAAFFLALLPQFVALDRGHLWLQFLLLGSISVALNTAADVVVVYFAGQLRHVFAGNPGLFRRFRQASGVMFIGLGAGLLMTRRTAP
jgi:threonine/homoserine/homoserine lactone efflux protein